MRHIAVFTREVFQRGKSLIFATLMTPDRHAFLSLIDGTDPKPEKQRDNKNEKSNPPNIFNFHSFQVN